MWQKLRNYFQRPLVFFTTKENAIIIQAYPRKGVVAVSYKGIVKRAYFDDNTMRNLMNGVHTEKNLVSFLKAVGELILLHSKH